ncbi:MAG: peroxiredoxin-like family protein [Catalinimonas sp.]
MKHALTFALLLSAAGAYAQLPRNAEDVDPIKVGQTVPDAEITALDGKKQSLRTVTEAAPTVLIFYRGGWCPFCNKHLAEVGAVTADLRELGYQVVAVSPDAPSGLQATTDKHDLDYALYSDAPGTLTRAMGLAFAAPERYGAMLGEASGGKNEGFLPVPALFLVDTDGTIRFAHVDADYKERLSSEALMAAAREPAAR